MKISGVPKVMSFYDFNIIQYTIATWKPNTWIPDSMGVQYSNG